MTLVVCSASEWLYIHTWFPLYLLPAQANVAIQEYEQALTDFKTALHLDPNNRAAHEQVLTTTRLIKERLAKERQMYAKMFDTCSKDGQSQYIENQVRACCLSIGAYIA